MTRTAVSLCHKNIYLSYTSLFALDLGRTPLSWIIGQTQKQKQIGRLVIMSNARLEAFKIVGGGVANSYNFKWTIVKTLKFVYE